MKGLPAKRTYPVDVPCFAEKPYLPTNPDAPHEAPSNQVEQSPCVMFENDSYPTPFILRKIGREEVFSYQPCSFINYSHTYNCYY
jgi:hypothetical protein